ncbi:glycosyltransferase family 2 protein [Maricaulaceae bacterium EIL42A08]|nr:glycosyltransferase family 2 protein [Maricaulaceae bacterium EIL42A08]
MAGEPEARPGASVAVLIVAYKSRDTIGDVIASLQAQTCRPARVRVLENGSPDAERVDPSALPDWVELVESDVNLGFAAGNNALAKDVEEDWLLFLNPDAFAQPDWIEQLMAATRRYPEASMFGSTQLAHGAPGVLDGVGDVYHATGLPYRAGYGVTMEPPAEGECFAPCGAAALYRRSLFERLGGFDEDYFCYVEDVDLAYRARLSGEICIQVREAVVSHMGYASSGRRSEFATYHGARNRLWTFFKDTPLPLLLVLGPVHLAVTVLLWGSAARFGQFTLFGKAMKDAMAGWSHLMDKRRAAQAARSVSSLELAAMMSWNPLNLITRAPHIRPAARDRQDRPG